MQKSTTNRHLILFRMDLAQGTTILTTIGTFTEVANLSTWQIWTDNVQNIEVTYRFGLWQVAQTGTNDDASANPTYLQPLSATEFVNELNNLGGYGYSLVVEPEPTVEELQQQIANLQNQLSIAKGEPELQDNNTAQSQ